jgi:hypothetical protein
VPPTLFFVLAPAQLVLVCLPVQVTLLRDTLRGRPPLLPAVCAAATRAGCAPSALASPPLRLPRQVHCPSLCRRRDRHTPPRLLGPSHCTKAAAAPFGLPLALCLIPMHPSLPCHLPPSCLRSAIASHLVLPVLAAYAHRGCGVPERACSWPDSSTCVCSFHDSRSLHPPLLSFQRLSVFLSSPAFLSTPVCVPFHICAPLLNPPFLYCLGKSCMCVATSWPTRCVCVNPMTTWPVTPSFPNVHIPASLLLCLCHPSIHHTLGALASFPLPGVQSLRPDIAGSPGSRQPFP